MLSAGFKSNVADFGIYIVIAAILAYLGGAISLEAMLSLAAMFGYASVAAIRELFLSSGMKTRIITVVGVLIAAVLGYGTLVGYSWATAEKFAFVLSVVFGIQLAALGHGIAKSGGQTKQ